MIKPGEIQQKARAARVRDQQIEKDYVLSWNLQGMAWHESLSDAVVFKGGTVLKKVYFEDYRFSEDLDFNLLDGTLASERIFEWFKQVFQYVRSCNACRHGTFTISGISWKSRTWIRHS